MFSSVPAVMWMCWPTNAMLKVHDDYMRYGRITKLLLYVTYMNKNVLITKLKYEYLRFGRSTSNSKSVLFVKFKF